MAKSIRDFFRGSGKSDETLVQERKTRASDLDQERVDRASDLNAERVDRASDLEQERVVRAVDLEKERIDRAESLAKELNRFRWEVRGYYAIIFLFILSEVIN